MKTILLALLLCFACKTNDLPYQVGDCVTEFESGANFKVLKINERMATLVVERSGFFIMIYETRVFSTKKLREMKKNEELIKLTCTDGLKGL